MSIDAVDGRVGTGNFGQVVLPIWSLLLKQCVVLQREASSVKSDPADHVVNLP